MVAARSSIYRRVMISISMKSCFQLIASSAVGMLFNTGCSSTQQTQAPAPGPPSDTVSYWRGDSMAGSPSVRIRLSEQRAYFFKGDQLAGVSLISSGSEGRDTVTGSFKVIQKDQNHRSSVYGEYLGPDGAVVQKDVDTRKDSMPQGAHYSGAPMPNFMRIVAGTGMHEGFLPGYPASHGCIRMPGFMAAAFFRSVSVGTPVRIEP